MRTTAIALFAIQLCWLVIGCGTILGRKELPAGLYPATRMDGVLFLTGVGPHSIVGENHMPLEAVLRCCIVVATIPDVPISVLTDTIMLPADLFRNGEKKEVDIPGQSAPDPRASGSAGPNSTPVVHPRPNGVIREGAEVVGVMIAGRRFPAIEHIIGEGETVATIAQMCDVPEARLLSVNGLPGSGVLLQPGDKLVIPMAESDQTQVPKK